ncbi:branched-chain amino acid aminotransferase [Paenibacillus sp. D9]|uniref:branched-chain amino acid aminotransferase n=1 Tax=Paenibacillus sp. D9 TaxID=665792 RepID=UPI00061F7372|nr:branched-chain amino acid aminotransferase [Paenibacillus sp. D9]KKC48665.1 branched-chain amino acid aminotransferase [Paenibacillus sp. D9]
MAYEFKHERTASPRTKESLQGSVFGTRFTDHMFILDYDKGQGWHDGRIVPYQPISLDPAAKVFHYGQTIFEGLKAYLTADGRVLLFRPRSNIKRMNLSNARLSIPQLDEELVLEALRQLIQAERDWVPSEEGTSLYVRPFVIATQPTLGVAPSHQYKFMIILSPVGAYYAEGVNPVSIYVESSYVRAVPGGVGEAKTAGNYAAGLQAQEEAMAKGYSQVLWLDGVHRKYIEEVGSMNVFFVIGDKVVTPALNGSILHGITRDSVITLLKHWGYDVEERQLSMQEVADAYHDGTLKEAFGTGTAAVISPIGELYWQGEAMPVNGGKTGELSQRLYDEVTGLQRGEKEDPFGWTMEL